jgi:hypothetical protein
MCPRAVREANMNNIESLAFRLGMIALILIATAWLWAPAP